MWIENLFTMLNHKERTTKASLLYDKPRLSKPNKTMTKDKSAMMNLKFKTEGSTYFITQWQFATVQHI